MRAQVPDRLRVAIQPFESVGFVLPAPGQCVMLSAVWAGYVIVVARIRAGRALVHQAGLFELRRGPDYQLGKGGALKALARQLTGVAFTVDVRIKRAELVQHGNAD
ncbi:hypothetical protein D3C73_1239460 [compost metagenome]